ncbi:unnamed protein product [Paramecium octaurelia]|uniref:Uncharacterized protein n=1 Tax=Paramecium octaurelia TaxID=43137 RepID=A0A8S1U2T7_PAROT|nr:unnamed protein product [Paramecium octaurelia]
MIIIKNLNHYSFCISQQIYHQKLCFNNQKEFIVTLQIEICYLQKLEYSQMDSRQFEDTRLTKEYYENKVVSLQTAKRSHKIMRF